METGLILVAAALGWGAVVAARSWYDRRRYGRFARELRFAMLREARGEV